MTDEILRTLTRSLHEHAKDVDGAPSLAAGARRRARHIQVRRRVTAGTVAAVALVAAVPTALSVGDATRTTPPPADTPTPTHVSPAPPPGTTTIALTGLEAAPEPATGWVEGTTFHRADGREITFPDRVNGPAAYGDGAVGQYSASVPTLLFANGDVIPGYGPAVSTDRSRVAWFFDERDTAGLVVSPVDEAGNADNSPVTTVAKGTRLQPVGLVGDREVVSNVLGPNGQAEGARIDVVGGESTQTPWEVDLVSTVSESAQLVAGRTSATDSGSCWAVLPTDGGAAVSETCDYSLDHFSPDGRHLLAGPAYRSGAGDSSIAVLDAGTAEPVHTFDVEGDGFIVGTAFEDDTHLLAVVWAENRSAIVRCDLDGGCERATDLADSPNMVPAFTLPCQP